MNRTNSAVGVPAQLTDVQNHADARRIPIQKAGVKDMRFPLRVRDRTGAVQHTIARFTMTVNLAHERKGVHMSRFPELLNALEREISYSSFRGLLIDMVGRLEADAGHVDLTFPYFVNKTGPVSGVQSLMDYEVHLIGAVNEGKPQVSVRVVVPVTSLCPCSSSLSDLTRSML